MYCFSQPTLNLQSVGEEHSPFLFGFWQEKTNEDSQMVVGGNFTVGARCAQRRRETQQGRIWVAALSTSREIPTQGIDRRLFSFALSNKRTLCFCQVWNLLQWHFLLASDDSPVVVVVFLPTEKYLMNHYPSLCAKGLSFQRQHQINARHSWAKMKTSFEWSEDVFMAF